MKSTPLLKIGALLAGGLLVWSCSLGNKGPEPIRVATAADLTGQKLLKEKLAALEAREGIKTEVVYIPWSNYRQKILTTFAAGKAPDLLWLEVSFYASLHHAGVLRPLDAYVAADKVDLSRYYRQVMARFTGRDGRLYALPLDTAPIACLYYNKGMFQEAGLKFPDDTWRWKDLLAAAQKLTKRDASGRVKVWGFRDNYAPDWMSMAYSNGATPFDDWKNPTRCTMDSPAFMEAVAFIRDLMIQHHVMPSEASRDTVAGVGDDQFLNGTLAMMRTGYWATAKLRQAPNPALQWDLAPFPKGPRAKDFMWGTGGSGWSMTRDAKRPDEAWKVLKFLAGEEMQTANAGLGYSQPALKKLAASPVFMGIVPPQNKKFLLAAPDKAVYTPAHPKWDEAYESVISPRMDLILGGRADLEATLKEITRDVNTLMFGEGSR